MKVLLIIISLILFTNVLPKGHTEVTFKDCHCATPFKDTREWSKGSRGSYYCLATSKKGNQYKRYFSQWSKLKK